MKKINTIAIIVITICLIISGCGGTGSTVNHSLIVNGVSIGTSTGLSLIKDAEARHTVANYLQAYAPGLRTITSNPTAQQLAAMIESYTPQQVKEQYPQVIAFASPLIINAVRSAIDRYGKDNATVIEIMNDVATGLETGAAGK